MIIKRNLYNTFEYRVTKDQRELMFDFYAT